MELACLARSNDGTCRVVTGGSPDTIAIARSVGSGAASLAADVRTIQAALNRVPALRGGPSPSLAVDGICGPKTLAAIKRFQQTHVKIVDSRIDPGGPTLAALNGAGGRNVPIMTQSLSGRAAAPVRAHHTPEFLPPDPEILAMVVSRIPEVRKAVFSANFRLQVADPFVKDRKLTIPTGPFLGGVRQSLEIIDAVFSLSKLPNPRPFFDNIQRIFRNMTVALNRSFNTEPAVASVLFVPNTHISMESRAAGYTGAGGAYADDDVRLTGVNEKANRIYVCRNLLDATPIQQVSTLLHELAHYVSGQPIAVHDELHGHMLLKSDRPRFNAIRPERKVRNADHYSFFAQAANNPALLT